jgi:hypothetical protein
MKPIETAEFTTAQSVAGTLDNTIARPTGYWSQRKISGTFRTSFDLSSFPFERHRLVSGIEEGVQDISSCEYEFDAPNSGLSPSIQLAQWKIDRFSAIKRQASYQTNFCDPLASPSARSRYSHIDLVIEISRSERTSFLKLAIPAYAATLLALIVLLMHVKEEASLLNARIGLLAASLFAVVFNLRAIDDVVGSTPATTVLDLIHFSALAIIIATTLITVFSNYLIEAGFPIRRIRRLDYVALIAFGAAFTFFNIYLVRSAMIGG